MASNECDAEVKSKDGTQYKAKIQKKSKVCGKCGTSVDPQWFSSTVITYQGQRKDESISGNILDEEEEFCIKCGTQRPIELKDLAAKKETKIHPAETFFKGEVSPMDTNSDNNYFRDKKINQLGDQDYFLFHFHVLVSPDFKLKWERHKVHMQMSMQDSKGSDFYRTFEMKRVRQVQGYEEMETSIKIEKCIVFGTGFSYIYSRYNQKKAKIKLEKYYKKGFLASSVRECHLLDKWKDKSEYHQYDGIMNRGESTWDYVKKGFSSDDIRKLEEDAGRSAEIFTQANLLSTENMAAMLDPETLNMLDMLLLGLEKRYLKDAKCWSSKEEFNEKMTKAMLSYILKSLESETGTQLFDYTETKEQAEGRMQVSIFVLSVIGRFKLPLSPHNKFVLARSLLLRPQHKTEKFHDLAVVEEKSLEERRKLYDYLIEFCNSFQMNDKNPSWLCCIPLLHLLSGVVKPYQPPTDDINYDAQEPYWWGIQSVKSAAEKFKLCPKIWMIALDEIVRCLSPLFELDYFLPRTLMSVLQLSEVEKVIQTKTIPPEVCIATCSYYIKQTKSNPVTGDKQMISCTKILKEFLAKFEAPERWSDSLLHRHAYLTLVIAQDMARIMSKGRSMPDLLREVVQIFFEAVALFGTIQTKIHPSELEEHQNQMLKNVHDEVRRCFNDKNFSTFSSASFQHSLKSWEDMLCSKDFKSPAVAEIWNNFIVDDFKEQWQNKRGNYPACESTLVQQYCSLVDSLHPCMQSCLGDLALEVIPTTYTTAVKQWGESERGHFVQLLSSWYEREWEAAIKKKDMEKDRAILHHILNWSPLLHFLKMFYGDERKHLSHKCIEYLQRAISAVDEKIKTLDNGEVTIKDLTKMKGADSNFQKLASFIVEKSDDEKKGKRFDIAKAVVVRLREVESYKEQMECARTLTKLCQHIPTVDLKDLDSTIERLTKKEDLRVKDICQPVSVGTITPDNYYPKITAFSLSDEVVSMLEPLQNLYESYIFINLWLEIGCQTNSASLEEVCEKVWKPVSSKVDKVTHILVTGEIQCGEMEKYLGDIYRDDYGRMVQEMISIKVPEAQAKERTEQLRQFRQLETYFVAAKAILDIVEAYELKGDFGVIKTIISKKLATTMLMKEFDDSLFDTCTMLQDFTPEKASCLNVFIECRKLVLWIRESVKDLKELKVFVDLASISAGEGDMEIAKVNCLFAAVTGYAPLIFDLDENSGYKDLLLKCQILWKELKADPKLPKSLQDTQRHLEWLKMVKQAHGSVEVTSLSQAEAINSKGIFLVGALEINGDTSMDLVYLEFKTEVTENVLNSIKTTYGQKGIDSLISNLKQFAKVDTCDDRVLVLCDSKHAEDVQKCVTSHYNEAEKKRTSPDEAAKKYLIDEGNDHLKELLEFAFGHTSWSKILQTEEGKLYLLGSEQMKREVEKAVQSMNHWYKEEFTLTSEELQKADEVVTLVKNELPAVFIKLTKEKLIVLSDNEDNIERAKYKVNRTLGRIKITGRRRGHANLQAYNQSSSDTYMSKDGRIDKGQIFPSSNFQSNQPTLDLAAKSYSTKEGLIAKVYLRDITSLPVDCIVNVANEFLSHDGGVDQAISKAAGRDFDQEGKEYIKKHGAIPVTQCCVTSSGKLPYKVVIHAVGPRWSDYKYNEKERCTEDLKKTIVNCLIEASKFKMASVAIPSLSSGIFGVPKPLCAQMYAQAVVEYSMTYGQQSVKEIHFVDIIPDMCQLTQSAFDAEFQCI